MHGADNYTFINLTSSSVTEATESSGNLAGTAQWTPRRQKGKGPGGLRPGKGQLPPKSRSIKRCWTSVTLPLMRSVQPSALEGLRALQPSPRCALFRRGPFKALLFPGHGAALNVNTLSRMQAPPARQGRDDAGSSRSRAPRGRGRARHPREALSPQSRSCRFPVNNGGVYQTPTANCGSDRKQRRGGGKGARETARKSSGEYSRRFAKA